MAAFIKQRGEDHGRRHVRKALAVEKSSTGAARPLYLRDRHGRRRRWPRADVKLVGAITITVAGFRTIGLGPAYEPIAWCADDRGGESADIRCAVRQAETKPLEDFKLWLDARLGEVSRKSGLAEAIRYALSHWEGLTRFLSDGRIEIDSNTVERTMRPIALGRRNYLFAGSDEGGQTWSILASLINSAKLNCIVSGSPPPPCNARLDRHDVAHIRDVESHIWLTI
jgi:transposase